MLIVLAISAVIAVVGVLGAIAVATPHVPALIPIRTRPRRSRSTER